MTIRRTVVGLVLMALAVSARVEAACSNTSLGNGVTCIQSASLDVASCSSSTGCAISFPGSTGAGHLLIVGARIGGTSTATTTDGSNTYNADTSLLHSGLGTIYLFSAANAAAVTTLTVTPSVTTTARISIVELSGMAISSPFDQQSTLYTAAGPSSVNSGSTPTTTQATELLVGVMANNTGESTTAGTSQSYVVYENAPATPNAREAIEMVTVAATGAYQADWSAVNPATDHLVAIATYKISTGGAAPCSHTLSLLGVGC